MIRVFEGLRISSKPTKFVLPMMALQGSPPSLAILDADEAERILITTGFEYVFRFRETYFLSAQKKVQDCFDSTEFSTVDQWTAFFCSKIFHKDRDAEGTIFFAFKNGMDAMMLRMLFEH